MKVGTQGQVLCTVRQALLFDLYRIGHIQLVGGWDERSSAWTAGLRIWSFSPILSPPALRWPGEGKEATPRVPPA